MGEAVVAHLGDPHQAENNLIDYAPRYDAWTCVHTEPPTMVRVSSEADLVEVRIYDDGQDPHETSSLHPTEIVGSILKREVDNGGWKQPLKEQSAVFYAEGALDYYNKAKQAKERQ